MHPAPRMSLRRLVALVGLLCASPAGAQGRAALVVTVRDSAGRPLPGAEVRVLAVGALPLRTDSTGTARFAAVAAGRVSVVARRFGFLPDSQRVALDAGRERAVTLRLASSAQLLDTARITAEALRGKMADFERRRAAGRGSFVTRADIEAHEPMALRDLLRRYPGVTFVSIGAGRSALRFARATSRVERDCPPEYWIDGQRSPYLTIDDVPVEDVEGIELYRGVSELPAPFLSKTAGCGVIAIWTRDGK